MRALTRRFAPRDDRELMQEYDEATLKRVQSVELGILKDFLDLCNRHDLRCFGIAGTGIGVLRHQGFIPWDDDIDIALPRDDYEQFLVFAKSELDEKYQIINFDENENYPLMTTRMMLRGTEFREFSLKDIDCPLGIFLDIYAFDNIPDDERLFRKQAKDAFVWSKLLILRSIPFPVLGFGGAKKKIVHAICACVHFMLAVLHVPKRYLYDKCYEASTRYRDMNSSRAIDYLCDTNAYINIIERADAFPVVYRDFEGIKVPFPNNLHGHLTRMYGDYMVLPPAEKRKNHFPYRLCFDAESNEPGTASNDGQ